MLRNEGMGGIRLSKSSVQMLDIVALLLRMRRVNSALTLIFRKKSNLINGKSSLGDGWSNVPSPGSTIPDVSAKIMRFPSLLLRLWLKSPISIPYSSAYEYSFLQALYDKSDGFYRRQLLLTTRDKADGREDDPFLIDKMKQEKEGIFLWGLEGLHRLMANRFRFTISERAATNLEEAREKGNNILVFLKSEGYFAITPGARCRSKDFYNVYERWCQDLSLIHI